MSSMSTSPNEQFVAEIANAVPHVVWTNDEQGNAAYFNQRWTDYTGASLELERARATTPR